MPPDFMRPGPKCALCVRIFKWFPVLFITAIVAWSYYAYVLQLCIFTIESTVEKAFYLIFYHAIFILFIWSYWQTIFTDIAITPKNFHLSPEEAEKLEKETNDEAQRRILEQHAKDLPISCRALGGGVRYCDKCRSIKPDRAHHCSVCGRCVLKMDHHCPWVNNCVCFSNYKFFVLFLGYALLYCIFITCTTAQYFVQFWTNDLDGMGKFHILFLFFVAVMFAISLASLFGYHCYLVSVNRSTLESFRPAVFRTGPDKEGFSLGRHANFIEIFGDDSAKWLVPVFTSLGDGVVYPIRSQPANFYNSTGSTTQPSKGDGVTYPLRLVDEDTDGLLSQRQRWVEAAADEEQGNVSAISASQSSISSNMRLIAH